jgi:hypothetical protein
MLPLDAGCPQDTRDALMAEPMAFRRHRLGNSPKRLSLSPQSDDLADSLLELPLAKSGASPRLGPAT